MRQINIFVRLLSWTLIIKSVVFLPLAFSEITVVENDKYLAQIELHTVDELQEVLDRAEKVSATDTGYSRSNPIQLVLHGEEVRIFLNRNYSKNKSVVDLAARLDAFSVVDIKVCEIWLSEHSLSREQLPPFIEVVPFGLDEEKRLKQSGHINF
jgi:intracellular sulfur oxidation DsrE/DsrF family protein